jgi:hypothetical protein
LIELIMPTPPRRRLVELDVESFPSTPFAGQSPDGDRPAEGVDVQAQINLVKVFSATKSRDRERLGDRVNDWIAANPTVQIVRTSVTQSSDAGFHCLTFVLFCFALT